MNLDEVLRERIGDYWSIAYREGREGRSTDTVDGDAQAVWHCIDILIKAMVSDVERWKSLCETQGLIIELAAKRERRERKLKKINQDE